MQFLQLYDVLIIFNENKGMIVKDFFINMCACVFACVNGDNNKSMKR